MEPRPSSSRMVPSVSEESELMRRKALDKDPETKSPLSLVGSIVEKGFSTTSGHRKVGKFSFPEPTVLPFPVARHRSHGPHWEPLSSRGDAEEEETYFDKEDMDLVPTSVFAQPVLRKKKKGLDFSKWKEAVARDQSATTQEKKMGDAILLESRDGMIQKETMGNGIKRETSRPSFPENDSFLLEKMNEELPQTGNEDLTSGEASRSKSGDGIFDSLADKKQYHLDSLFACPKDTRTKSLVPESNKHQANEKGSMLYMDDIDAENCARLQQMSPNEIAEIQQEIMEKMRPRTLEMLKKRGREKLEKQKRLTPDVDTGCQPSSVHEKENLIANSRDSLLIESVDFDTVGMSRSVDSCSAPDNNGGQAPTVSMGSWEAWRERVESAGTLRFLLDGSVVGKDSVQMTSDDCSQYTADNVTERDFLRTEGDPGAAGYTIKEGVALLRSMIPGQRALALQLLASVLDKASFSFQQSYVGCKMRGANHLDELVDWQAVWAYALGPEPELALSLRMALDDNHVSVVLACAKVIHHLLCADKNENFFNMSENFASTEREICTAPVFRSKPVVDVGFLRGGFWKYSAKASSILPSSDKDVEDDNEEKRTIQDDIIVAGQDVAAGLVRMGILTRIRYILEVDQIASAEECLISILIALARHSPACSNAIIKCPRLVETVINRFIKNAPVEFHLSEIKSVTLLKVLAQSDEKTCLDFIKQGVFHYTTRNLYNVTLPLDHWLKSGREYCKLNSAMLVEQLRFWKVCIHYGYCISYFADFFPAMCFWLRPPPFEKLVERNLFCEFASVTREAYLTLGTLARRLPALQYQKEKSCGFSDDNTEAWSWSHAVPLIEMAMKWTSLKNDPYVSSVFKQQKGGVSDHISHGSFISSLLWVISSVVHLLSNIFEKMTQPEDDGINRASWLPEFVPKIGLGIIENGLLNFSGENFVEQEKFPYGGRSLVENLCCLRNQDNYETSLSSVCCLHGLVQLIVSIDKCMKMAKGKSCTKLDPDTGSTTGEKILEGGIVQRSQKELRSVLNLFMTLMASEWHDVQSIEIFGRGGPAPGLGLGWGASVGGFWSTGVLLAQMDAQVTVSLLEIFPVVLEKKHVHQVETIDPANDGSQEKMTFALKRINSILGVCLVLGPRDVMIMEKTLSLLLGVPVLKYLNFCVRHFLRYNERIKLFDWDFKEDDYHCFSKVLSAHFRSRWLSIKRKLKDNRLPKRSNALDTIPEEDVDALDQNAHNHHHSTLELEWARQRLPIPENWFLSPLTTFTVENKAVHNSTVPSNDRGRVFLDNDALDVAKSGLFLLLGLEAVSYCLHSDAQCLPVLSVPLVWKLHALSTVLLVRIEVLEEERNRDVFEALQNYYGQLLTQSWSKTVKSIADRSEKLSFSMRGPGDSSDLVLAEKTRTECGVEILKFQAEIHESYPTFVETIVEQYGSVSFGDVLFGRQVALYLHRSVEVPIRLAAWNALSNAQVLELLPSIRDCFADAEGFLEPNEDNEEILQAYVKSWTSGSLDKAAVRGSVSFTLALHHLSSFIFLNKAQDKLCLRNKLVKSLLRDYCRKSKHKGMLLDLIQYEFGTSQQKLEGQDDSIQTKMNRRFELLSEACEGNLSLLAEVEKLKSSNKR